MTSDGWITLAILIAVLVALFGRRLGPAPAMLGGCAALYVTGAAPREVAFGGFSASAPWIIAGLYVLAGAVQRSGALDQALANVVTAVDGGRRSLARLLIPAAAVSSVTANTPVVATLIPALGAAARRRQGDVRSVLLPLSFATMLGGTITVLGSSTNVAASTLLDQAGLPPLVVTDLLPVAGPVAAIGLAYLLIVSPVLLRRTEIDGHVEDDQRYEARLIIGEGSPLVGTTVDDLCAELNLHGHAQRSASQLGTGSILEAGDVLELAGGATSIITARDRSSVADELGTSTRYFEAVVAPGSDLVGRRLGTRTRSHTIAFARRSSNDHGDGLLHRGDVVLVLAAPGAIRQTSNSSDYTIATRLGAEPTTPSTARRALLIAAVTVVAASISSVGLLRAVICGVGLLVATGVVRPREALKMVNLEIVVLIAAALGVSGAVVANGLAADAAARLHDLAADRSTAVVVLLLLVATIAMTELLTNVAAVAVMVPVAVEVAPLSGLDPRELALAVIVAASASFLTPFGYQTNTMVWRPGGYRFRDFLALGAPLTAIVVCVLTVGVVA